MHRQFFRLLLSIVSIILVVIAVQCISIFTYNRNVKKTWTREVFDEFADAVAVSVKSLDMSNSGSDTIVSILVNKTSERISGIILRDQEGKVALSLGMSPKGIPVPQLYLMSENSQYQNIYRSNLRFSANMEINPQSITYEIDKPRYELAIFADANPFRGTANIRSVEFKELDEEGSDTVAYPSHLEENDIAGTILISVNGTKSAYMDVLVYDLDFYNPTKFLLAEMVRCLSITFPIAFIVSIVMAAIVSKRTGRVIEGYKNALNKLSRGQYDIDLPKTNVDEYEEISKSIQSLGVDLERHSKSRKEWIRNISHDLNTPVTSMNLLLDGASDGFFPIDRSLICNLKKENDTLMERIASVSYYSYLLSPSVNFTLAEEPLINIVDEVLQLGGYKARVEFNPEIIIASDHSIAKRAIEEVVKNAVMYKTTDSCPIIRCERAESSVVVRILNDGHLPDPLPLFFEPWSRGDDSRTSGGSGLGLSIVYQAMELHGGSVAISEEDGMVTVTLEFPDMRDMKSDL